MKRTNNTESIGDFIRKNIYTVRGVKVMIDSDLAHIYGYTTSAFNQQVRNNSAKFDEDFRFRLTKEEYQDILKSKNLISKLRLTDCESTDSPDNLFLRSKFLTSKTETRGGRQYYPYVFTEQGIYMLMTVLKGKLATEQSKALIRTFKEMKDFIIDNQGFIGSKELLLLSVQTTQNTADILTQRGRLTLRHSYVFTIGNETADSLVLVEETAGYHTDYSVGRDCHKHTHCPAYLT